MTTATPPVSPEDAFAYEFVGALRRLWWIPLLLGIVWIAFSLVVFRFDVHSVRAVGLVAGIVFLVAGLEELVMAIAVRGGWKWFHALLGLAFVVGGIASLIHPGNTFLALAEIVGWVLVIKGAFDVIVALANRHLELWWTRLAIGLVELGLAFTVSGNIDKKAVVLLVFVGATALLRGIGMIVVAFQLRSLTT